MKNVSNQVWGQVWRKYSNLISYNETRNTLEYSVRTKVWNQVSEVITNQVRNQLLTEFKENLKV
jgi:hypothetical protein